MFSAYALISEGKPVTNLTAQPNIAAVSNSTLKGNDTSSYFYEFFNKVNANKTQSPKNIRCKVAIPGKSCMNGDIQFYLQTSYVSNIIYRYTFLL